MTSLYFFTCVLSSYITFLFANFIFKGLKYGFKIQNPFKLKEKSFHLSSEISPPIKYIKKKISRNALLLIIFLLLLCSFYVVRYSYFFGTDGWAHIYITRFITDEHYLPLDEYFGAMGLHIFSSVIYFFSGIELVYLPKYFVFYSFMVTSLLFYNIQVRIFKNNNLALLGVFILQAFPLGFGNHLLIQFWPTSLTVIMCLEIFFLLYVRMQNFVKLEKPSREALLSNMIFCYSFAIILFVSAILTHTLVAVIMLISFIPFYLIYFLKDVNRGFDLALLCGMLGIFFVLLFSGVITEFVIYFNIFKYPWYYYAIGGICGSIGAIIVLKRIVRYISFSNGAFKKVIEGENSKIYSLIEDKYIYPVCLIVILGFILVFLIGITPMLNINFSKTLIGVESTVLILFSIWGLFLFQKKPRGKILLVWLLSFGVLIVASLAILPLGFGRIALLAVPVLVIGFVSYFYKLIKIQKSTSLKISLFLVSMVIFSFFAFYYDDLTDPDQDEYGLKRREVYSIMVFSKLSPEHCAIDSEFGWSYIFIYYGYPYGQSNGNLSSSELYDFLGGMQYLFHPSAHINESGVNILKSLKQELGSDVFLILDDTYLDTVHGGLGKLTNEEIKQYNNLNYLNKVLVSKSDKGTEIPYYWVI
ncbi:MAG: hypothetical protein JW891_01815 [Candidatus Lokiarchaeota archaeon]|nr:hypothetical protein [Candidatus Lokiarchaeota archaeon]